MKPSGRDQILEVLNCADFKYQPLSNAEVQPVPEEGQDVRFVRVYLGRGPQPHEVLNALDESGLIADTEATNRLPLALKLVEIVDAIEGEYLFEDIRSASDY